MARLKVPDIPVIRRFFPDASELSGNSRKLSYVARLRQKDVKTFYARLLVAMFEKLSEKSTQAPSTLCQRDLKTEIPFCGLAYHPY